MDQTKNIDRNEVTEGHATIYTPKAVFYNPVQEFNRDLTIAVISLQARQHFQAHNNKLKLREAISDKEENQVSTTRTDVVEATKDTPSSGSTDDNSNAISGSPKDIPPSESINDETDPTRLLSTVKYRHGLRVLEGLSASGLRSVRFALEIPGLKEVIANDLSSAAVEFIRQNVALNKVGGLVTPSQNDASLVMYAEKLNNMSKRYHTVDLDPYGSPTQFLDAAVQSVADQGILCVTCTDMAVLCGNCPETCHAKYGSTSLRTKYCHEAAVRIVLRSIDSHANRYQRYIEPLLSLSIDFYTRVFVRVRSGQANVKRSATRLSRVFHCTGCGTFKLQPIVSRQHLSQQNYKYSVTTLSEGGVHDINKDDSDAIDTGDGGIRCIHCGGRRAVFGPVWNESLHDRAFVEDLLGLITEDDDTKTEKLKTELAEKKSDNKPRFNTASRMKGMLNVVLEELDDCPFYYHSDEICKVLHCTPPTFLQLRSAILNAGYKVSNSHAIKNSLKTNAPSRVIWDIMRCWIKDHPVNPKRLKGNSTAKSLLDTPPQLIADFTLHPDANPDSRKAGMVRYQTNPEPDWGPKPRAAQGGRGTLEDRRQKGIEKANERRAAKRRKQDDEETVKDGSVGVVHG